MALATAVAAWLLPALLLAPKAWEQATTDHPTGFAYLGWVFLGVAYVLLGGLLSAVALLVAGRGTEAPERDGGTRRWTQALVAPLVAGTLLVGAWLVAALVQRVWSWLGA